MSTYIFIFVVGLCIGYALCYKLTKKDSILLDTFIYDVRNCLKTSRTLDEAIRVISSLCDYYQDEVSKFK